MVFFLASVFMVWRSFYDMRIDQPMLTAADFAYLKDRPESELTTGTTTPKATDTITAPTKA